MNAQKVIAAAAKVKASAAQMEKAAALTEVALTIRTRADAQELREIVHEKATDDVVGDGMQHVLERMRQRAASR